MKSTADKREREKRMVSESSGEVHTEYTKPCSRHSAAGTGNSGQEKNRTGNSKYRF